MTQLQRQGGLPGSGLTRGQTILVGWIFILAGLPIIGIATGTIPSNPASFHAPHWVVGAAGATFTLAGIIITLPPDDIRWIGLVGGILVTTFTSIFTWVAFGPGERHFSGGFSIGGFASGGPQSERSGRIWFGVAAVLMCVYALFVWVRVVRAFLGDPGARAALRGDDN